MKISFSYLGLIIFILPMLINIVYFVLPPAGAEDTTAPANRMVEMIEQTTRILYAIAICVLVSRQSVNYKSPWLFLGLLFLILYYIVWIRYFAGGREVGLLGKSFLGVPMPLAVFPVLYFIFAAIWLHNYIAVVLMIIFGIAHNIISYASFH